MISDPLAVNESFRLELCRLCYPHLCPPDNPIGPAHHRPDFAQSVGVEVWESREGDPDCKLRYVAEAYEAGHVPGLILYEYAIGDGGAVKHCQLHNEAIVEIRYAPRAYFR